MRIKITIEGHTEVLELPSDIDFVGVEIPHVLGVNASVPQTLGGMPVECIKMQCDLPDEKVLIVYLYKFSGKAKVLSHKEYAELVLYDIMYENLRIGIIV